MTKVQMPHDMEEFLKTAPQQEVIDFIAKLAKERPDIHALLLEKLQNLKR